MYAFTYEAPGTTADAAALAAQGGLIGAGVLAMQQSLKARGIAP